MTDYPFGHSELRHYRPSRRRDCAVRCAFVIAYSAAMVKLGLLLALFMMR